MNPRVSILLPVWNRGETLASCLRSILRQREPGWECIVVDDGSTDDSRRIAEDFAASDPRIRVVARPHGGLIEALNAGLSFCRAPLVARMDADDWMHRDRLALQCDLLEREPALDAAGCHVRAFPRASLGPGDRRYEAWLRSLASPDAIWRDRYVECGIAHPTLIIRRARLLELAYRDLGWPEDWDLLLRLLERGPRVGVVPRRLVGWRHGANRTSRRDGRYALDRFMACRADHLAHDFLKQAPEYLLWGHGPTARALRRALESHDRRPAAIIEVHPRRIGQRLGGALVIPPDALAARPRLPLVACVSGAEPRSKIREFLAATGWRDGIDFVCAA